LQGRHASHEVRMSRPSGVSPDLDGSAAPAGQTSCSDPSVFTRLLEGQNQVFERIARGEPLPPTLDLLLRLIERHFPGMLCSILTLDPDGVRVRHVAAPSLPESFTRAIDGQPIGPHARSWGTAAFRRELVIVEDIEADPLWDEDRALAAAHGLRACWSTPICDEQRRVLGIFAIYFGHPARPDPLHLETIELATHTAAIAIERECGAEKRRRAHEAMRRREAQLAEAQRIAHIGSFEWDPRSGDLFWSAELSRIFGIQAPNFRPTLNNYLERVHPDDRERVQEVIDRSRRSRTPFEIDERILRPDGTVRLLHSRGRWLVEGGEPVKLVGTCQDVTEQRQTERELQRSQERFQLAARATNDVIWDWNLGTDTVWWSPNVCTLFGYRPDEVEERLDWWRERIHPDDVARFVSRVREVMTRRESFLSEEYRFRRADGSYADVLDRGYVMYNAAGGPFRMIGAVADISERKRAMELLERRVGDRTAELHLKNAELEAEIDERRRIGAELSARNEELKAFAYTVSHDLKTPLRGIAGYAEELEQSVEEELSPRGRFCLNQILAATRRLDRLIEDLLRYSRVDAEPPTRSDVRLADMLAAILRERRAAIRKWGSSVDVDIRVAIVRTWERGLIQVVGNLLDNALKYSRLASPPRISIRFEPRDGALRISVADNGIGFDLKYHDRIFGLFNRLVRQEDFEGTGAGLAIVKKVVEKMGGRIWAESAPREGAVFFVDLPDSVEGQR